MWLGLAAMGMGLVSYYLFESNPETVAKPRQKYRDAMGTMFPQMPMQDIPRRQSQGFAWDIKDPEQEQMDHGKINKSLARQGPYLNQGMLNVPLPVSPEIAEIVDLKYQTPTAAKKARVMRDDPSAWLPEF
jgi:hypothetical protein